MSTNFNRNPTYRVNHKDSRENPSIWTSAEEKAFAEAEAGIQVNRNKAREDRPQMLSNIQSLPLFAKNSCKMHR